MRPLEQGRRRTAFRRALLAWFCRRARDLPWRRTRDPYHIWLSEVLLQQTQVETVRPYYERFVTELPSVQDLAAAPRDRVLKLWEGLGYYRRARHLHDAARLVANAQGGQFPHDAAAWQQLPGIGRYTAAAIASITQDEPVAALDGNIKRVLARLFCVEDCIDATPAVAELWTLAELLLSRSAPGDFNQAMMELGARVCRPRNPDCAACPVHRWCAARAAGVQGQLPRRRPKRAVPQVEEVAGVIRKRGRYLLLKRPPGGLLGGLWEFPGGQLALDEEPAAALMARLRDTLRIDVAVDAALGHVEHAFTHRALRLHVYACRHVAGHPHPPPPAIAKWVSSVGLEALACSRLTRKVLARL